MFWKKSFKGKIENANRVFSVTIEKLKNIQVDMTSKVDKNLAKIQKLTDENAELEAMKVKVGKQIEEIGECITT